MDNVTVDVDLDEVLAGLDELEISAKAATRPAAQAGAQVFYEETKQRAPVHERVRVDQGKTRVPGTLRDAIYQAYSKDRSDEQAGLAVYHVSWNRSKAPHGHLVEFGHKMPFKVVRTADGRVFTDVNKPSENPSAIVGRRPFLRPAYDAARTAALQASRARLLEEVRALMPGLQ